MARATETKAVPKSWTVEGKDESGAPEVTTVELVENPAWTPESPDDGYRYLGRRTRGHDNDGRPFDVEGFDTPAEALSYARDLMRTAREEYRDEEQERRSGRRRDLIDLIDDWHAAGDDARLVRAVASAIGKGRAARVLAVLAAAEDFPELRSGIRPGPPPSPIRSGGTGLNDDDVMLMTGSAG